MATRHTGGPNPSGYICPKRKERRVINIYVEPDLAMAVREFTARDGTTVQDKGEELFRMFVEQRRQDHPTPRPSPPSVPARSTDLVPGDDPGDHTSR
jgi:hypothetical protein